MRNVHCRVLQRRLPQLPDFGLAASQGYWSPSAEGQEKQMGLQENPRTLK